ncbi:MAG: hypothetical protein BWK76_19880 [Desulfobulbaceae bacterium A2]|nr:MAG: hypothetical protein BWK76_19880 [Desulfobulbaceae bacterium A2]
MPQPKERIFTFKADENLADLLDQVPNKSAFIRQAILAALERGCPLCQGTGVLSPEQQKHWAEFLRHHSLERCETCRAVHLICNHHDAPLLHPGDLSHTPLEKEP